jgi:Zn-dependent protease with chaperone function
MFAVRCLGVSLSFFLLLYAAMSFAVTAWWRQVRRIGVGLSPRRLADALFALRSLPFVAAAVVTLIFVVPSFLLLEPRAVAEPLGEIPLTLGGACLALFCASVVNAIGAYRETARTLARWLQGATAGSGCDPVPLFRIRCASPAIAVAGVREPCVLVSDAAAAVLSEPELEIALRHEVAHIRRYDNLKKLLFRCFAFPGMTALETAWSEAAEMAADDAAVSSSREALDLASALIKLSRLPATAVPGLSTALLQGAGALLNARVERLIAWTHDSTLRRSLPRYLAWYLAPAMVGSIFCLVMSYGFVLGRMHDVTEWLVR